LIVLDTHAWLFWSNDNTKELSAEALGAINSADRLGVSIISCWEVAMLVSKERIKLSIELDKWINEALNYPRVELLNIYPEIAILSTRLPGKFHKDPADRFIVATCIHHNAKLITKDRRIRQWKHVSSIW